jgi:hypothetical protein
MDRDRQVEITGFLENRNGLAQIPQSSCVYLNLAVKKVRGILRAANPSRDQNIRDDRADLKALNELLSGPLVN